MDSWVQYNLIGDVSKMMTPARTSAHVPVSRLVCTLRGRTRMIQTRLLTGTCGDVRACQYVRVIPRLCADVCACLQYKEHYTGYQQPAQAQSGSNMRGRPRIKRYLRAARACMNGSVSVNSLPRKVTVGPFNPTCYFVCF